MRGSVGERSEGVKGCSEGSVGGCSERKVEECSEGSVGGFSEGKVEGCSDGVWEGAVSSKSCTFDEELY